MKKEAEKVKLPKLELRPSGLKDKVGNDYYSLYIDEKTDKIAYDTNTQIKVGKDHKGNFAALLLAVPCKCFPENLITSIKFSTPIMNGIIKDEGELLIEKDKKSFTLSVIFNASRKITSSYASINGENVLEAIEEILSKNTTHKISVDLGMELRVSKKGTPDETIEEVFEKLIEVVENAINKVKIHLLQEIKDLEHKVKEKTIIRVG